MARVWRDGQKRRVHIYRLLTTVRNMTIVATVFMIQTWQLMQNVSGISWACVHHVTGLNWREDLPASDLQAGPEYCGRCQGQLWQWVGAVLTGRPQGECNTQYWDWKCTAEGGTQDSLHGTSDPSYSRVSSNSSLLKERLYIYYIRRVKVRHSDWRKCSVFCGMGDLYI